MKLGYVLCGFPEETPSSTGTSCIQMRQSPKEVLYGPRPGRVFGKAEPTSIGTSDIRQHPLFQERCGWSTALAQGSFLLSS